MDTARLAEALFGANPSILEVARRIATHVAQEAPEDAFGQKPRTLIYGGFVRDALWGVRPREADIQIFGVDPLVVESLLQSLFPDQLRRAGKQYQVLKIELGRDLCLDISVPRTEIGGHSPHELGDPTLTPEEASYFRDFTVNGLSADPLTGEILDYHNAVQDVVDRRLRVVNPQTFRQRPVHVFRACQLSARFDLSPDAACIATLSEMVEEGLTAMIPGNAVAEELKKLMMKARKPSQGIRLMHKVGVFHHHFKWIDPPENIESSKRWREWINRVDRAALLQKKMRLAISERNTLVFATFCSILPEPASQCTDEYIEQLRECLSELALTPQLIASVIQSILNHGRLTELLKLPEKTVFRLRPGPMPNRGVRIPANTPPPPPSQREESIRFLRSLYPATWPTVLCLAKAVNDGLDLAVYESLLLKTSAEPGSKGTQSLLNARDVIEITGIIEKEEVGQLLHELRLKRYELITGSRAREYLRALWAERKKERNAEGEGMAALADRKASAPVF